ncbi:ArsR/SmtB family transcription factor [Frigidibacter mobilis]|uniref:Regulatory protein ArsR n=1 Tax=Frigidibacter mobilis TaxID=1335048 RepID=A0A159YZN8_9RHOB|nr:winged helix-turn-helix domain-containing protein [Frigidibacter mobilis]AMY68001.1 regulatory protein ArsR [Frigidibacter mobilis]
MTEGPDISRTAALIGDPARAGMLAALMRGQALTVSELAAEAGIGLPTASAHLARLEGGGLIAPRRQGRHKYFALASDEVAALLEALMRFSAGSVPAPRACPARATPHCGRHGSATTTLPATAACSFTTALSRAASCRWRAGASPDGRGRGVCRRFRHRPCRPAGRAPAALP